MSRDLGGLDRFAEPVEEGVDRQRIERIRAWTVLGTGLLRRKERLADVASNNAVDLQAVRQDVESILVMVRVPEPACREPLGIAHAEAAHVRVVSEHILGRRPCASRAPSFLG